MVRHQVIICHYFSCDLCKNYYLLLLLLNPLDAIPWQNIWPLTVASAAYFVEKCFMWGCRPRATRIGVRRRINILHSNQKGTQARNLDSQEKSEPAFELSNIHWPSVYMNLSGIHKHLGVLDV